MAYIVFSLVSVLFIGLTLKQNTYWKGEISLFERTVRFEKTFGRGHALLAGAYYVDGQYQKAIHEFEIAQGIMKGYADKVKENIVKNYYLSQLRDIYLNLAHCYEALQQFEKSPLYYQKALSIRPDDDITHFNLAMNYIFINNVKLAIEHFERSIEFNDNHLMAKNNLAIYYQKHGEMEKAEKLLRDIVRQDPMSQSAKSNLKAFLKKKGEQ